MCGGFTLNVLSDSLQYMKDVTKTDLSRCNILSLILWFFKEPLTDKVGDKRRYKVYYCYEVIYTFKYIV